MSFGFQQAFVFKESSTYGDQTDLSVGSVYVLPVKPNISLKSTYERIKTEHVRGVASTQSEEDQLGAEDVRGGIEFVVPWASLQGTGFHSFCILLKHLLGKVTTTGPSGTTYTHTYHWNDKLFVGLGCGVNKAAGTYMYDGLQIASMKLSATVGGPLLCTVTFVGKTARNIATVSPAALTLLSATPYVLFHHATFEVDDVSEPITGFEIEFTNALESDGEKSYALGSQTRVCLPKSGHSVTGTVRRRHDADDTNKSKFWTKFRSGATAKLEFIFTHPTDADFSGKITLGATKFEEGDPQASDAGIVPEVIPFTAYDLDDTASSIVWTDEELGPVTATGAYDGTGA